MYPMTPRQTTLFAVLALTAGLFWLGRADAAELLMFRQDGCVWCERWEREIGVVYDKTAESQTVPLRRINLVRERADGIALASPVRFTPTFVVVEDGREIGRILGYASDHQFWGLLGSMIAKLQTGPAAAKRI